MYRRKYPGPAHPPMWIIGPPLLPMCPHCFGRMMLFLPLRRRSPCAVSRRALRREGMPVILDGLDLGGHACYSSRHTNFTLTKRLDALAPLWPRLRASPAPAYQKRAALATACCTGLQLCRWVVITSLGCQQGPSMDLGGIAPAQALWPCCHWQRTQPATLNFRYS